MSEPADPFDLLHDLNPVAPEDVANAAYSDEATRALEEIIAGRQNAPPRWRQRRLRVPQPRRRAYLLALVPLIGGIAAAAWALTQVPSKQLTIGCYASADLQARTVVVPAGASTAVDTCRGVWQRGDFGSGEPIPTLQACVLASGAIGVFPSPDQRACRRLRLVPLTPTPTEPNKATSSVQLKNVLVALFLAHDCMGRERAAAAVTSEIDRLGLTGLWEVQVNGIFTNDRPCASLAFDEEAHRVLLVPMPKRP